MKTEVWATHPKNGDQIIGVHDNCAGMRGTLVRRDGTAWALDGSWVFAPGLSWVVVDGQRSAAVKAGLPDNWLMVGGQWQY